jgi:hypothetical protein
LPVTWQGVVLLVQEKRQVPLVQVPPPQHWSLLLQLPPEPTQSRQALPVPDVPHTVGFCPVPLAQQSSTVVQGAPLVRQQVPAPVDELHASEALQQEV